MRGIALIGALIILGALAALSLALSSNDAVPSATADIDLGPPPPCFDSWEDAEARGFNRPDPNEHGIIFITDPTPTDGPPFDMTKTPPPPGFDSWDEVIDLWIEADSLGLFDTHLPPPTPEFEGPPPLGCSTWQEFIEWTEEQGIFGPSTGIADKPAPNATLVAMRHFEGAPPPCFSSVDKMFEWYRSAWEAGRDLSGRSGDPPFNCESWEEFYQYMEKRFLERTPTPAPAP